MRRGRGVNTGIRYFQDWEALKVGTVGSLGTWSQRRNKPCSAPNNPVIQGQVLPAEVCLLIYLFIFLTEDNFQMANSPAIFQECMRLCAKSLQSWSTLCNPTDYSPPGSSIHGFLQARILDGEGNGSPLLCSCLGESQGWGSLVGCLLWGRTESDMTEAT